MMSRRNLGSIVVSLNGGLQGVALKVREELTLFKAREDLK